MKYQSLMSCIRKCIRILFAFRIKFSRYIFLIQDHLIMINERKKIKNVQSQNQY